MTKRMKQFVVMALVLIMSVSILAVPAAAEGYTASIPVEIQIDPHYVPAQKDTFQIKVTPVNSASPMPDGHSTGIYEIVCDNTNTGKDIINFTFPGLGVYEYTISQENCGNGDCYHDDSVYELAVYVINENPQNPSAGGIVVQVVMKLKGGSNDPKPDKALFVNKYAAPDQLQFRATKYYNSKTPKTGLFQFRLQDDAGKTLQTVSNVGKDVTFDPIVYNKVGTYVYKLSEIDGGRSGVRYDKAVYTITVDVDRVVAEKGDYVATVTYRNGAKVVGEESVAFYNKSVTEGNPFTGDQFRLVLWSSILVISVVAMAVVFFFYLKKRK